MTQENVQSGAPVSPAVASSAGSADQKPVSAKESKNLRMFLIGIFGLIAAVIVGFAIFGAVRVYAMGGTDNVTKVVATVLRFPLAKINGHVILYKDYLNDLKAIHTLKSYDEASGGGTMKDYTESQLSDQVVWRLVNNIFIDDLANKYGVTAAQSDIDDLKNQMLAQFKSSDEAEKELMQRYGWTLAEYEKKVIGPYVLQTKLSDDMETNKAMREETRERAQKVLNLVKPDGSNFAAIAKQYGEDNTANNGGSFTDENGQLKWFGKGEMVSQFEDAAFAMKKGETSKELVETSFGYHIIHIDDRKTESVKGADGKTTNEDKLLARHIVILFPSLDSSLDTMLKQAQVAWYTNKIHNPIPDAIATTAASSTNK